MLHTRTLPSPLFHQLERVNRTKLDNGKTVRGGTDQIGIADTVVQPMICPNRLGSMESPWNAVRRLLSPVGSARSPIAERQFLPISITRPDNLPDSVQTTHAYGRYLGSTGSTCICRDAGGYHDLVSILIRASTDLPRPMWHLRVLRDLDH